MADGKYPDAPRQTGRAWTFEKKTAGCWLGSLEPQADRYRAACEQPTCRNRGPKGRSLGGGPKRWIKTFWVVSPATALQPGAVLRDGRIVPPTGWILNNAPLASPCHSVGQAKKLLRKLRRRHTHASLIALTADPRYAQRTPAYLSTPSNGGVMEMRHE
jgi:hypothetical protein